jgi:hypothetical protein
MPHILGKFLSDHKPVRYTLLQFGGIGNLCAVTVSQISQRQIEAGAFYLSACRTAVSEATSLEDEALVLTSAFQIVGFARISPHGIHNTWQYLKPP